MTAHGPQSDSRRDTKPRRRWPLWFTAAAVLAVAAWWLTPRYRAQLATVDDGQRWRLQEAPPSREIVWQTAVPLSADGLSPRDDPELDISSISGVQNSHIRPQLAERGGTLYFTIHDAENGFQIVRSQLEHGRWSAAEPVDSLNSPRDDIGPVIRDNGQTLYLYSDRDGGFGGMDIYVSYRMGDQWSTPRNLGRNINSPAQEYDPAIDPDGLRLVFASNRSDALHRQWQTRSEGDDDFWHTTLRNDPGHRTFDLYASNADPMNPSPWQPAEKLERLCTPEHNEGAAFWSPDGAFLYFASDRPTERDEPRNFDLYRAAVHRPDSPIENLGPGINTAANEIEPSLTASGFQISFSRSESDRSNRYALFQSTAKEVYHDRQWEATHWHAFTTAFWKSLPYLWLLLALLALLALLTWAFRWVKRHRVAISSFLVAAVLLHLFMVFSSFFVFFQQQVADQLKSLFEEEPVVASQVLFESTSPETAEQPSFDRVAELEMPEPFQPAEVAKQVPSFDTPMEMQPIELARPTEIATPNVQPSALSAPLNPVVATFAVRAKPTNPLDTLQRATAKSMRPSENAEEIELQQTIAVATPSLTPVQKLPTELSKQKPQPLPTAKIEPLQVDAVEPHAQPTAEKLELDPVQDARVPRNRDTVPLELARTAPHTPNVTDADSPNEGATPGESIMAADRQPLAAMATQAIDVERTVDQADTAVPQPEPQTLAVSAASRPTSLNATQLQPLDSGNEVPAKATSLPPSLQSRTRPADTPSTIAQAAIDTDSIASVPMHSVDGNLEPKTSVEVQRRGTHAVELKIDPVAMASSRDSAVPIVRDTGEPLKPAAQVASLHHRNPLSNPLADGLLSRKQRSGPLAADAQVNLQSLLRRRSLDEAMKSEVVKQFGGSDETLAAILRSLTWIEQHQFADGHWGLHSFHERCEGHKHCDGRGNVRSDTAGTGLALLPFLGDGNTHKTGKYKDTVARGMTWLIKNQKDDGNLFTGGEHNAFMYSHAIATIAICECYGMSGDPALKAPAQKAIDFIIAAQDERTGGWRYQPRKDADTSVVGWQVMALKSGQMAELNVPQGSFQEAHRWLKSVAGERNQVGQFGYQRGRFTPAMTAEAVLCLEYMNEPRDSDLLRGGTDYMLGRLPKQNRDTSYYWYYGTQAMFHQQGEPWHQWNDALHPILLETQRDEGPMAGTWNPRDQWEHRGGRLYTTSLRVLMLEVYYRHLPIYQVIE